ncbi:hypothetical protein MTO96_045980 [Rhipicephalus appendiculatus]
MGVKTAVQLFSPAVTAALKYMRDQAGHTCDFDFALAEPTITFMEIMHKWFSCMDVSNLQQHIHCNDENARHFDDIDDARVLWLEGNFLAYIEELKNQSTAQNFRSKETYHALVLSTKSNVQCIRYLLTEEHF